ncbi:MAG: amidohydrolase family protein, partial [Thermodesulfovibrionales bacterium]|nr:amidohydrolase family protein [Thermodesulfovibrionales bacterium]
QMCIRDRGIGITADSYPYIASSTDLDSILPSWVFSGGLKEEIRRLRDPQASKKIKAELSLKGDDYWDNVYISSTRNIENKWMEGKSLSEIALTVNKDVVELVLDLIVSENAATEAIFFIMNEDNLKKILSLPYVMVGTDSSARSFSGPTFHSKPHPRGFGTFPRFISVYVRDEKIINLPEAIRRVTSLPARTFSIEKRGLLKEGFFADIVIFDYYRLKDRASYTDPFQSSEGIEYLFVNGQLSIERGKVTGVLAGRILV